jgi:TolB-like protein
MQEDSDHRSLIRSNEAWEVVGDLAGSLGSAAMSTSPRSRDFAAYLANATVAGRGDRQERTMVRRALGRGDTFAGRFGAPVRVPAIRVRKSLEEHYADAGRADRRRSEPPADAHALGFVTSVPPLGPASAEGTLDDSTVVVLPFAVAGEDGFELVAMTITEVTVRRLATFPGLRVIGPATTLSQDPRRIGRELGGRFVLQGSVGFREPAIRLSARLTDATRGDVVWAATETIDAGSLAGFEVEEQWAAGVAAEIGDYAGAVYRRAARTPSASVDPGEHAARLAFQAYVEGGSTATLRAADDALARARDAGVRSPVILAMLGTTRADRAAARMSPDPEADLAAAEQLAREALAKDPRLGHAYTVLGTVALVRHQWDLARKHAAYAAQASPFHPTTLATAGSLIACAGDWQEGAALLRESLRLNPLHPGYMHTLLAQDRLMVDDDAAAWVDASRIHGPGGIWGPLLRAMALAGLGYRKQARLEMDEALAIEPTFLDHPLDTFTRHANLTDGQLGALLRHLEPFRTRLDR